ncbi:L-rhamnose-binding lectin CSL3-like [Bradysia coprophila]|uniref:L-rhamnose-binding lectin CSL3-like n=1 Tax=Bradysia coprophila TaxID=38358 RepID=UPI00187D8BBC|nr:L-rhamnose-binding lectin CSL3-like [Bradysia coprophila]
MITINTLGFLMIVAFVTVDADIDHGSKFPKQFHVLRLSAQACERSPLTIRCNNGVINVISANYGRLSRTPCNDNGNAPIRTVNCVSRNSLDIVKAQCSNQESCTVQATNGVFGDPCEGTFKYLQVEYQCTETESRPKRAIACEHSNLEIECERGERISVLQANYGRTTRRTCSNNGNGPVLTTNCKSQRSVEIVRANCGDKRQCTVSASNGVFGDPCVGTLKYLEVMYLCVRRRN